MVLLGFCDYVLLAVCVTLVGVLFGFVICFNYFVFACSFELCLYLKLLPIHLILRESVACMLN